MTSTNDAEITRLLQDWSTGNDRALHRLVDVIYHDLEGIARRHLRRERFDHTLSTQALVHESYLNLADGADVGWRDRGHFFAVASRAMRRILIDHARRRLTQKRGGGQLVVTLQDGDGASPFSPDRVLDLEEALCALEKRDEQLARVVECRFYAGLTVGETAEALGQSRRTVERNWTRAKAYLMEALAGE